MDIAMKPVGILLVSVGAWSVCGTGQAGEPQPAMRLLVGVERSLPVRGQPCRVWAEIALGDETSEPTQPDVSFFAAWHGGEPVRLGLASAEDDPDGDGHLAQIRWTPERLGPCRVSATAALLRENGDPVRLDATPIDVFATTRKLHFNYWACGREQRYLTSVMDNTKKGGSPREWRRRGVLPLVWKGGHWLWTHDHDSPEKVADNWLSVPQGRVGVMIDEFGGGGEVDQQLGTALLLTRRRDPRTFLAPYCLSVAGEKMIEGFAQSDLILVETYTADWRGDGTITGRWRSAAKAGLTEKSIAVLGVGSQWTGTAKELRRIFRMVRATCPDMPGLGFFPNVPPRLAEAVDAAIEDYFLRPVITASVQEGRVVLRNIGETPATGVELAFLDAQGTRLTNGKTIGRLGPWTETREALPPNAVEAKVIPAPKRYTALAYVPPLELQKPDAEAKEAALQFRKLALSGEAADPLARADEMRQERSDDKHKNAAYHNNIQSATVPIRADQRKAVALAFDLRLGRSWFYGGNSVSLGGEGTLTLHWSRNDHDAGIPGDQPRPVLTFTGRDEYTVREVSTMGFSRDRTHHVLLAYDGRDSARAIVTDEKDELLWDSGRLPAQDTIWRQAPAN